MRMRTCVPVVVCVARKPRPCPSYSGCRDRNNSVHWRSLYKGGGGRVISVVKRKKMGFREDSPARGSSSLGPLPDGPAFGPRGGGACRAVGGHRGARPPGRGVLNGNKKKVFRYQVSQKSPRALHVLNHGWWRLAVGGGWWWLAVGSWQLAVGGGWWWLVVVGGGWLLAVGGWRRLAVVGSWRLVAAGGWRRLVAGGWRRLVAGGWRRFVAGGWWRLAVDGSWRLAVGGPLGRSLRAVLSKQKKNLVP